MKHWKFANDRDPPNMFITQYEFDSPTIFGYKDIEYFPLKSGYPINLPHPLCFNAV